MTAAATNAFNILKVCELRKRCKSRIFHCQICARRHQHRLPSRHFHSVRCRCHRVFHHKCRRLLFRFHQAFNRLSLLIRNQLRKRRKTANRSARNHRAARLAHHQTYTQCESWTRITRVKTVTEDAGHPYRSAPNESDAIHPIAARATQMNGTMTATTKLMYRNQLQFSREC